MDRNLFFYFSSTIKSNFTLECHHRWCQLLRLKTTVFSLQNKKRRQEWEEMNTTIKTWEAFYPCHSCPSLKQNTIYNLRYKRKRATIPSLLLKKHTYFLHLLETKSTEYIIPKSTQHSSIKKRPTSELNIKLKRWSFYISFPLLNVEFIPTQLSKVVLKRCHSKRG